MRVTRIAAVAVSVAFGLTAIVALPRAAGASFVAGSKAPLASGGVTLVAAGESHGVVAVPDTGGTVTVRVESLSRTPDWCAWHDGSWGDMTTCVSGATSTEHVDCR